MNNVSEGAWNKENSGQTKSVYNVISLPLFIDCVCLVYSLHTCNLQFELAPHTWQCSFLQPHSWDERGILQRTGELRTLTEASDIAKLR